MTSRFLICVYFACMYVYTYGHTTAQVSEDNLQEPVLSFHPIVGLEDQTQVTRLGTQHHYSQSITHPYGVYLLDPVDP